MMITLLLFLEGKNKKKIIGNENKVFLLLFRIMLDAT